MLRWDLLGENYTNTRSISFPGFSDAAYSSHDGQFYLGRVEAGYPISFSGFTMVPTASLAWGHLDQDGYTEASPAGAALSIGSEHDNSLRSELGLKAFVPVLAESSFSASLGGHAEWMHEYTDLAQAVSASCAAGSPNFLAIGPTQTTDLADLGADFEIAGLNGGDSLTVSYSALVGGSFVEQTAMLRARVRFDVDLGWH